MAPNRPASGADITRRRAWPVIAAAVAFFGLLVALPLILPALHLSCIRPLPPLATESR
jgi:hypothetical protein